MKFIKLLTLMILLVISGMILCGCVKTTDPYGYERRMEYGLIELHSVEGNGSFMVCYDPTTMVCYMVIIGHYRLAVSPYYIIGEDGTPEIAVYGVNYK